MAQMLNQPAFLMVPSGFSRIRVSLRGRLASKPWATTTFGWAATIKAPHSTAANPVAFSLIGRPPQSARGTRTLAHARSRDFYARFPSGPDATPHDPRATNQICGQATPVSQTLAALKRTLHADQGAGNRACSFPLAVPGSAFYAGLRAKEKAVLPRPPSGDRSRLAQPITDPLLF